MNLPSERLDTFSGDSVTEFLSNVALGQIPDAENIMVVGHNSDISLGSTEVIWPSGGTFAQIGAFPADPVQAYISSSSASDIGNVIKVDCIDSDWNRVSFGVTLNGENGVALPMLVRRVLFMYNAGSTVTLGNVYAGTQSAPTNGVPTLANTLNSYDVADQSSHSGIYTVPAGYVALIYEFGGGTPTNDSITVSGYFSNPMTRVFKSGMHIPVYRGHTVQRCGFYPVPEKCDIYMSCTAYTNNATANSIMLGVLLPSHYMKS